MRVPAEEPATTDATGSWYDRQLIAGLTHHRPDVAQLCAWVLGQRRCAQAVGPLCALLRCRQRDVAVCVAAVEALGRIGDPVAAPTLCWILDAGYAAVRAAAVRALLHVDPEVARTVLPRVAAEDPAAGVRELASQLLDALRREGECGRGARP